MKICINEFHTITHWMELPNPPYRPKENPGGIWMIN
ncbi:DUF551 domain-containing protein [Changchengzhania lutea]|nr:DUF551 domain-containing protein [Changchengzhania lutea]